MATKLLALAAAVLATLTLTAAQSAEPKHGGILKFYHRETPPSLSIHEEATFSVNAPAMGIFNNLVIYDQHKPQNSMDTIRPELATSWAWSKDNLSLTFKLRSGVKWHDGVPFTAKDVKCTFDLLQGKSQDKFRKNPRKGWYAQVADVTVNGDDEVTFHMKRPQPSLLAMLASGYTPIYPCHVPAAQMRTHPIGTGPFKFVEEKQNESIKLVEKPRLLEKGPAVSRRHRIHDHQEPRDRGARLRRRQGGRDVSDRDDGGLGKGHQGAGPDRDLRTQADQCQHQSHRQSR